MTEYRLAVIGGGNMGAALVGGLLAGGWQAADIVVVEVAAGRRDALAAMFPAVANAATVPPSQAAVIAVKPYDAAAAHPVDRRWRVGRGAARGMRCGSGGCAVDPQHPCIARQRCRGDVRWIVRH